MPNKNYVSGRNFEYRVRDYLISYGYTVLRSAGSHTPIDLIAFNHDKLVLIQCKHGKIKKSELDEFIKLSIAFSDVEHYLFLVATAERNGKNVDIVFYVVTPAGNLIRLEGF